MQSNSEPRSESRGSYSSHPSGASHTVRQRNLLKHRSNHRPRRTNLNSRHGSNITVSILWFVRDVLRLVMLSIYAIIRPFGVVVCSLFILLLLGMAFRSLLLSPYVWSRLGPLLSPIQPIVMVLNYFKTGLWHLSCSYTGFGCSSTMTSLQADIVGNATYSTDLEIRNAYSVINNLDTHADVSQKLILDSVNIHSVGDAALYMSSWTQKEDIADSFYSLATVTRSLGRDLVKLDVKGKATMAHIINLYDQLRLKLNGFYESEYSTDEVLDARDRLLDEVEEELKILQGVIIFTTKDADATLDLSQRVGSYLTQERGNLEKQRLTWGSSWNWKNLGRIQTKALKKDLELTQESLELIHSVKTRLGRLALQLDGFHESVMHARLENRRRTYMGLNVKDILASLDANVEKSRKVIEQW